MKPGSLAGVAALAFLTAAPLMAQARSPAPPSASAHVVKQDGRIAITMTTFGCTKDRHLVTGTENHVLSVQETRDNPVTPAELEEVKAAYETTYGAFRNAVFQAFMEMLTARQAGDSIRKYKTPMGFFSGPENSGIDTSGAARKISALPPELTDSHAAFSAAVNQALNGNMSGKSAMAGESYTVSRAPSPQCAPKP